jgi:hypothetical protein
MGAKRKKVKEQNKVVDFIMRISEYQNVVCSEVKVYI